MGCCSATPRDSKDELAFETTDKVKHDPTFDNGVDDNGALLVGNLPAFLKKPKVGGIFTEVEEGILECLLKHYGDGKAISAAAIWENYEPSDEAGAKFVDWTKVSASSLDEEEEEDM